LCARARCQVIAYAGSVPEALALRVTRLFYGKLAGQTTLRAISEVRKALRDWTIDDEVFNYAWASIGLYSPPGGIEWTRRPPSWCVPREPDPDQRSDYWGRRWLLANLRERVLARGWVGLHGFDGWGKTATMRRLDEIIRSASPKPCKREPALVIDFGLERESEGRKKWAARTKAWRLVNQRVVECVEIESEERGPEQLADRVVEKLGSRTLILDNLEQLTRGPGLFPGLRALFGSDLSAVSIRNRRVKRFLDRLIEHAEQGRSSARDRGEIGMLVLLASRVRIPLGKRAHGAPEGERV
jgi:hypothetical protein